LKFSEGLKAWRPLRGEGQNGVPLPQGLLTRMPLGQSTRFLPRERWKEQFRESSLPGGGFGFVQRELKEARLLAAKPRELTLDLRAHRRQGIGRSPIKWMVVCFHTSFPNGSVTESTEDSYGTKGVVVYLVNFTAQKEFVLCYADVASGSLAPSNS
jgi:hypothetical protein